MFYQLGPLFSLKVAGKRLTFVTEAGDFHHFFQSKNVDFQKAVEDAVQNTGILRCALGIVVVSYIAVHVCVYLFYFIRHPVRRTDA